MFSFTVEEKNKINKTIKRKFFKIYFIFFLHCIFTKNNFELTHNNI